MVEAQALFLSTQEIEAIFAEHERLAAKSGGAGSGDDAKRASMIKKPTEVPIYIKNKKVDLNNHNDNTSKPFYVAKFKAMDGDNVKVEITQEPGEETKVAEMKGVQSIPLSEVLEYSRSAENGIADMVEIDELNPASLLYNLRNRYKMANMQIYTYVGPILLVLNPFKAIPGLNDDANRLRYCEIVKHPQPLTLKKELEPHSFALTALAYQSLKKENQRQGIVISGESGAGKTESAKVCMEFLTKLVSSNEESKEEDIGEKILACNPILEGFGNAKTVRNDNSSRFGKYVLMYFALGDEDKVYGARIKNYLLEKSRVISVAEGERGYHIFYFLLGGASHDTLRDLNLVDAAGKPMKWSDFNYLKKSGIRVEDAAEEFAEVESTMKKMNLTDDEIMSIWKCVAAILLLGQLEFDKTKFNDEASAPGEIKNKALALKIATMLGFQDPENFVKILLIQVNMVGKQKLEKFLSHAICIKNRDSLSKKLYDNMFNWLVIKMNKTIEPDELNEDEVGFRDVAKTIGLLDIFGFENFAHNNFEQFCINYVNEKLHKLYIAAIFEAEKFELTQEGLPQIAEAVQYPETQVQEILLLMDYKEIRYPGMYKTAKPPAGIFTICDDKSDPNKVVKWEDFFTEVEQAHAKNKKIYQKDTKNKARNTFTVFHSAQNVSYDIKEFTERNCDSIPESVEKGMDQTTEIIQNIYKVRLEAPAGDEELAPVKRGAKAKTIWSKFGTGITDLMEELGEPLIQMKGEEGRKMPEGDRADALRCQLHFIRCIKPRPKPLSKEDKPGLFVHSMTLQQITYMGVLESVDLKQKNFPFRKKFEEFYSEYELLGTKYADMRYDQMRQQGFAGDWKAYVEEIFDRCNLTPYKPQLKFAIGNTKVLMMPQIKEIFDKSNDLASQKYNQHAKTLKEAFMCFGGVLKAKKNLERMKIMQRMYKFNYMKKQKRQRDHLQSVIEKAIIAYKADKRFILEQKAGKRIQDVLDKHIFRNKLAHGLKARETIVKHTFNRAYINRIGKLLLCMTLQKRIVNNAFAMAKKNINDRAAWNVQRAIRGYLVRNKEGRLDVVKDAIARKENLRLHVSAKKVQKRLKGLIVRRRIAYVNEVASRIQSYFRMRWFNHVFQKIRANTMILQRAVRRYQARRDMIKERMRGYLMQEYQSMENVREMESFMLFGDQNNSALVKQQTPYSAKKIFLFSRIVDQHVICDLSDMHSSPWSSQFMQLYKDNMQNDTPLMNLQVGQSHSIASTGRGRTYVWGWNDNGQCARDPLMCDEIIVRNAQSGLVDLSKFQKQSLLPDQKEIPVRSNKIVACEDRCIVQLKDASTDDLIVWGGNERGQLGLGHYSDVHQPTRLSFFSKQQLKVDSFAAGGNLTLASCETGESFAWPFTVQGQKVSYPVRMPFSETVKIRRVSCGYNFGFFLSTQGCVYAVGKDNKDGQLGLGHVYPNDVPELVKCFKDAGERIDSIECGFRHSIAKSTLGKVYTWGWNVHGQLGHGTFESELSPRQIHLERGKMNRDKAIQIAAGYSHSLILTDSARDVLWFGTSGTLHKQSTPVMMNLAEKLPSLMQAYTPTGYPQGQQIDFANVKITCTWSKTLSVTNLMIADLRAINQDENYSKISQVLDRLSKNWDQREILPPYIEVVANLFSANVMRKGQQRDTGRPLGATPGPKNGMASSKKSAQTVRTNASGRTTPYRR